MSRFEIPIEEVRDIFSKRGCKLLSKKCLNQGYMLKYVCECGKKAESTLKNFKKRKNPCTACGVPKIKDIKEMFKDKGCELLSKECKYESDSLEYKCACGRLVIDTLHNFKNREKPCRKCNLPSVEDVQNIFINLNVKPLFDTFDNMKQKLPYICLCGQEKTTIYERIIKGQLCRECGNKKKAYTYEQVKEYFEENGCVLLTKEYINCYTPLKYICSCKNSEECETNFNRFKQGHRCKKCGNMRVNLIEAERRMHEKKCILLTTAQNYDGNLEYKCQCGEISRIEYRQFMRSYEKWKGCKECYIRSQRKPYDDVFDLFDKKGLVLLDTNYFDRNQKLDCICSCKAITKMSYTDVLRGRLCINCADSRRKDTNIKKYGAENPFQSEVCKLKIRKTMLERYGYEHNLQNPKILEQALSSNYRQKEYIAPNGTKFLVQGYEPFSLDYIINEYGINEKDIITDCSKMPIIYYYDPEKDAERRYYPDIFVPSENTIIEVKSQFTYDKQEQTNIAKFKAVMKEGYNMELHIFDEKGILIEASNNEWLN